MAASVRPSLAADSGKAHPIAVVLLLRLFGVDGISGGFGELLSVIGPQSPAAVSSDVNEETQKDCKD
jgi:hypothetical protein